MKMKIKKLLMMVGLYRTYLFVRFYQRDKNYRNEWMKFYRQFIKEGDLCFDIGGNVGRRTDVFLKLGATVVTAEPHDGCMLELQRKFGKNKRVTLIHRAIGEKEGISEMMTSTEITQISSLSNKWVDVLHSTDKDDRYNKTVKVPVTTLNQLIQQYGVPVFCKIDVEGFEEEVLKGLSQPIKVISFEFHAHSGVIGSALNCINYLSRMGKFQYNYSLGESITLNLSKWAEPQEICENLLSLVDDNGQIGGDVYAKFSE
jgi:FkbM family methyltransferase